jgi:hypothetical protein
MNVKKIKKILKHIGFGIIGIVAIAFTVTFIVAKTRSSDAGKAITEQIRIQTGENNKLRGQITSLSGKHSDDIKRIGELEGIRRGLEATIGRMEELLRTRQANDIGAKEDLSELGDIVQRDREALDRIRELLQDEDS